MSDQCSAPKWKWSVGAEGKLQAEGCAWLDHWQVSVAAGMVTPGLGTSSRAPVLQQIPWMCLALQQASWGCSAACLCMLFPLHDHKSSSQTALTSMVANTSTYMCVYVLCPGGVGEAEHRLQSPVVGHCSAGKRLIQG